MRWLLILLIGCTGHSTNQLAETPVAQRRAPPAEAPPASTSDVDRSRLVQGFDDMQTTQEAHREAAQKEKQTPAPKPIPQQESPPKKLGPAIQGPPVPKKKN